MRLHIAGLFLSDYICRHCFVGIFCDWLKDMMGIRSLTGWHFIWIELFQILSIAIWEISTLSLQRLVQYMFPCVTVCTRLLRCVYTSVTMCVHVRYSVCTRLLQCLIQYNRTRLIQYSRTRLIQYNRRRLIQYNRTHPLQFTHLFSPSSFLHIYIVLYCLRLWVYVELISLIRFKASAMLTQNTRSLYTIWSVFYTPIAICWQISVHIIWKLSHGSQCFTLLISRSILRDYIPRKRISALFSAPSSSDTLTPAPCLRVSTHAK